MKTFIIALCVFCVITAAVIWGGIFIERSCTELEELVTALPPEAAPGISDFDDEFSSRLAAYDSYWQSRRAFFDLTIGHDEVEKIEDALDELIVRYSYDDGAGYMSARRRLIELIRRIRDTETLSLHGIL